MQAKITPVRNPTSGMKRTFGVEKMPKRVMTLTTANEKKSPLVPAQRISPRTISVRVTGAARIPS